MKERLLIVLCLIFSPFFISALDRTEYQLPNDLIDIVIPCHEKDQRTLEMVLLAIKTHIPHGRLIVVSREKFTDNAEWFNEDLYPFSKMDVAREIFKDEGQALQYIKHPLSRIGWIYQQFLKLYAPYVISGISKNVLIVDADTIFFRRIDFLEDDGTPLYSVGSEYISVYFDCIARLIPGLKKVFPDYSGICHHMLFQKPVLDDLFAVVESIHRKPLWKAVCHVIDHKELFGSFFSEYELYFNFLFTRSMRPRLRFLRWENVPLRSYFGLDKERFDYVSCHEWLG